MSNKHFLIARITDAKSGNWWCKYYSCTFQVLSIREETVLVKCNMDEGYPEPYNVHEIPLSAVELLDNSRSIMGIFKDVIARNKIKKIDQEIKDLETIFWSWKNGFITDGSLDFYLHNALVRIKKLTDLKKKGESNDENK